MKSFLVKYNSSIHTFVATFLVTLLGAVSVIPADKLFSPSTWTTALIAGILVSALRAGLKAISPIA